LRSHGNNSKTQREQICYGSIEDTVEKDNVVRAIEAFVEHIELKELGFCGCGAKNGRTTKPQCESVFEIVLLWLPKRAAKQP